MKAIKIGVALFCLFLVACQSGQCRKSQKNIPKVQLPTAGNGKATSSRKVKIFRYDGSLQCGQGNAIELKEMAKELKDIEILSMYKKPDGLMHIQVCGSPTGIANVYVISEADLGRATALGFKKWTFYE